MKEQTRWTPKRLLSLLLALVMLLGVMPTAVFAAEVGNGETYYFDPTITGAKTITFNRKLIIVQPIGVNETPGRQIADGRISDGSDTSWNLSFFFTQGAVDNPGDTIDATVNASIKGSNSEGAEITEVSVKDIKTGSAWAHRADTTRTGQVKVGNDGCARFQVSLQYKVGETTYTKSANVVIMSLWTDRKSVGRERV